MAPVGLYSCDNVSGAMRGLISWDMKIKHLPTGSVVTSKPPSGPDWVHEIKHDGYTTGPCDCLRSQWRERGSRPRASRSMARLSCWSLTAYRASMSCAAGMPRIARCCTPSSAPPSLPAAQTIRTPSGADNRKGRASRINYAKRTRRPWEGEQLQLKNPDSAVGNFPAKPRLLSRTNREDLTGSVPDRSSRPTIAELQAKYPNLFKRGR